MEAAKLVAILIALFVATFLPMMLSGSQWKAAEDKARATDGGAQDERQTAAV